MTLLERHHKTQGLLFLDKQRTVLAANAQAIELLGLPTQGLKGQPLGNLADGALAAVATCQDSFQTTIINLPSGRSILAHSRPLTNDQEQFLGWRVMLRENDTASERDLAMSQDAYFIIRSLIQQMHLIQMLIHSPAHAGRSYPEPEAYTPSEHEAYHFSALF